MDSSINLLLAKIVNVVGIYLIMNVSCFFYLWYFVNISSHEIPFCQVLNSEDLNF